MAKVIKLDSEFAYIGDIDPNEQDDSFIQVSLDNFNTLPKINDEVEIYRNGEDILAIVKQGGQTQNNSFDNKTCTREEWIQLFIKAIGQTPNVFELNEARKREWKISPEEIKQEAKNKLEKQKLASSVVSQTPIRRQAVSDNKQPSPTNIATEKKGEHIGWAGWGTLIFIGWTWIRALVDINNEINRLEYSVYDLSALYTERMVVGLGLALLIILLIAEMIAVAINSPSYKVYSGLSSLVYICAVLISMVLEYNFYVNFTPSIVEIIGVLFCVMNIVDIAKS